MSDLPEETARTLGERFAAASQGEWPAGALFWGEDPLWGRRFDGCSSCQEHIEQAHLVPDLRDAATRGAVLGWLRAQYADPTLSVHYLPAEGRWQGIVHHHDLTPKVFLMPVGGSVQRWASREEEALVLLAEALLNYCSSPSAPSPPSPDPSQ